MDVFDFTAQQVFFEHLDFTGSSSLLPGSDSMAGYANHALPAVIVPRAQTTAQPVLDQGCVPGQMWTQAQFQLASPAGDDAFEGVTTPSVGPEDGVMICSKCRRTYKKRMNNFIHHAKTCNFGDPSPIVPVDACQLLLGIRRLQYKIEHCSTLSAETRAWAQTLRLSDMPSLDFSTRSNSIATLSGPSTPRGPVPQPSQEEGGRKRRRVYGTLRT